MIIRPRPTAFGLLFMLRGSILPMIAPRVLIVWEGRRQLGQLLAETRCMTREIVTLLPDDASLGRRCARRTVAFAHALRGQLRGINNDAVRGWLQADEWQRVAPRRRRADAILLQQGEPSDMLYRIFSERLPAMTGIQTACERLRSTPTPFTYTLLLHRTAWLFCLLLPFGMVGALGLATPLFAAILACAFFGLDALGEELEEPFGQSQNALPLDAMVRTIEIVVGEALGETALPEASQPRNFIAAF